MTETRDTGLNETTETVANTSNGYAMLMVCLVLFVVALLCLFNLKSGGILFVIGLAVSAFLLLFVSAGFYLLNPNQAAAIQLFGEYRGSDRNTGLRWVLPWLTRKRISVRVHNVTSSTVKVNDLRGNPIEIATNVVWRVTDTAKALFDVEDYHEFVDIQIESAVRVIGARYPYDDLEHKEVTLRGDAEEVSEELEKQLQERVAQAGVIIDECRLTHLAYAPEIAQAMLRRQQAEAVVAARTRLVDGAVGMVEMALEKLNEKDVVDLDDERRAAMVSNLMVVLCGERDTQPVVNTGSLYQ
ncbi:SPFH domain-containing protein [Alterisphingorhabdus coralli]|uniref:SPFH domain-containing protein n=1 Tax=Alterisphingorhabdus coralli TaxID=3071408 RepID=A0AA97F8Z8_9SPHN|nr:SPFH domain-containing protein [Parasphingorhabdus sp. SCSIO 66989]WOE76168.1 SPFH domain-containing protein [Parasphingorhabdus sp. SCSIO 66989]